VENWVWLLVLLLAADAVVLAWVLTRARPLWQAQRREFEAWRAALEADPWRERLYRAHWRARWRTGLGTLLDLLLSLLLTWLALLLAGPRFGFDPRDGVSDPESFLVLLAWVLCYLLVVFGGFRAFGTTPGLTVVGIAVVSSRTGRAPDRAALRPPTKWDYRRDRVPELLFVPKEELGTWE
jgi:hypothetical protein